MGLFVCLVNGSANLKLRVLQLQTPSCWDYRCHLTQLNVTAHLQVTQTLMLSILLCTQHYDGVTSASNRPLSTYLPSCTTIHMLQPVSSLKTPTDLFPSLLTLHTGIWAHHYGLQGLCDPALAHPTSSLYCPPPCPLFPVLGSGTYYLQHGKSVARHGKKHFAIIAKLKLFRWRDHL